MSDPLSDVIWLYRGVPGDSVEVEDVHSIGEIRPPRPDRIGERWRQFHVLGDTQTGYTSWTTDRNIAEEFAQFSASGSSGQAVIFRLRVASIPEEQVSQGRDDEAEFLLEGIVEEVSISESAADEEGDSND